MPLNMQPLSDKFGVAITGVDLRKSWTRNYSMRLSMSS